MLSVQQFFSRLYSARRVDLLSLDIGANGNKIRYLKRCDWGGRGGGLAWRGKRSVEVLRRNSACRAVGEIF